VGSSLGYRGQAISPPPALASFLSPKAETNVISLTNARMLPSSELKLTCSQHKLSIRTYEILSPMF
jgi:hypothetical protein